MNRLTWPLMLTCTLWAAWVAADGKEADDAIDTGLLAGSCYGCHAASRGQQGAMPNLWHLSIEQVSARLTDYQQGDREATVMSRIASGYSEHEIERLANYFGRATP